MDKRTLAACILLLAVAAPLRIRARTSEIDPKARAIIETRAARMADAAGLDAAGATRLRELGEQAQVELEALARQDRDEKASLERLLAQPSAEPAQVSALLDRIAQHESQAAAINLRLHQTYRKLMTEAQYGRMVVAWPRITRP